jgi:hypothetical protein
MNSLDQTELVVDIMAPVMVKILGVIDDLRARGFLFRPSIIDYSDMVSYVIMLDDNQKIRIGVVPPKENSFQYPLEGAKYFKFDSYSSAEIIGALDDEEYAILCEYAAKNAVAIYKAYLLDSTEGHLNLFHNREFSTKRDMYKTFAAEAQAFLTQIVSGELKDLKRRFPIS